MCVAEDLEGLEGGACPIAHDRDVRLPVKTEMKEEAQVLHNGFRVNPVIRVGSLIHEAQSIRGGVEADTGGGAEVNEFSLCWLHREVVAEEPLITQAALLSV